MPDHEESLYYQHAARNQFASRISQGVRRRMFEFFMEVMTPSSAMTVLDIGVSSDTRNQESNYFEELYPYKSQITCVGTEDGSHLGDVYAGVRFIRVTAGERLPFADNQFDVAFSNAVIEHVGGEAQQRAFIAEALRVSGRVFITTPNRWFPIEHHTGVPLLHLLPKPAYRAILRRTSLSFWAHEENLNHLTLGEFRSLFPRDSAVRVRYFGLSLGLFSSNLIAYTSTP